jgi:hypothetical protein
VNREGLCSVKGWHVGVGREGGVVWWVWWMYRVGARWDACRLRHVIGGVSVGRVGLWVRWGVGRWWNGWVWNGMDVSGEMGVQCERQGS